MGQGAVGAFVAGVAALGEPTDALRITAAAFSVAGIVMMKVAA